MEFEWVEVKWVEVEWVEVERVDVGLFLAFSSYDISHNSSVTSTHSHHADHRKNLPLLRSEA